MHSTAHFQPMPLTGLTGHVAMPSGGAQASPDDPAARYMTDLVHGPCVMADHLDGLDETLHVMLRAGVHMAFVTGVDGGITGLVGREDLQGEKPVQRALADHLRHDDLTLEQVMTPTRQWQVLALAAVSHARLGDIEATLRTHGLRYLPVVDTRCQPPKLCGLFSARRLEAALGHSITDDLRSHNFAELEYTLNH